MACDLGTDLIISSGISPDSLHPHKKMLHDPLCINPCEFRMHRVYKNEYTLYDYRTHR